MKKNNADWTSMTDKVLTGVIGKFIQHHRLNQNRSQDDIANDAGISRSTLSLLERGESVSMSSLIRILRVLDLLYIMNVFEVEKEVSPIEYAKLQKGKRKRSRTGKDSFNETGEMI